MPLVSPNPTQFDLKWRMLGTDIRVNPWFWATAVFLGWRLLEVGFQYLLIWVVCVFVSVLLHEFGHVIVGRIFGSFGHIVLYGFGGLAIGSSNLRGRGQRVAVSFAGPLAQFLLLGVLLAVAWAINPDLPGPWQERFGLWRFLEDPVWAALGCLIVINWGWPLFNLLPIWPLDGGQISRELFQEVAPRQGTRWSLILSVVTATGLAIAELASMLGKFELPLLGGGTLLGLMFFAMFAAEGIMLLQQTSRPQRRWGDEEEERLPWERDPDYWKR